MFGHSHKKIRSYTVYATWDLSRNGAYVIVNVPSIRSGLSAFRFELVLRSPWRK